MDAPDIVVIVFDDMREQDWEVLPRTRELVGGTWFPNFVCTTPVCGPSRATLLTGCLARTHGVRRNDGKRGGRAAFRPHEGQNLATALQGAGYHTALVGKYLNGYDRHQADPPGWSEFHASDPPAYGWEQDRKADRAVAVAAEVDDQPLFLWYAAKAPHGPHLGLPRRASEIKPKHYAAYDAARRERVAVQDHVVERIAEAMGARWDAAVVVVVSDNGYLLGEGGYVGKGVPVEGALRVPALVRCPGLSPGEDPRLVANIDICPTILRAAGVEATWPMDGVPLQDGDYRLDVPVEGWPKVGLPWRGVWTADGQFVEGEP